MQDGIRICGRVKFVWDVETLRSNTYIIALYGSETWTLRKLKKKYLESFEMWSWRRMEKIKWSDKVTYEQALERIGEKRTLLNNILRIKSN
jgi:hypothetical protein